MFHERSLSANLPFFIKIARWERSPGGGSSEDAVGGNLRAKAYPIAALHPGDLDFREDLKETKPMPDWLAQLLEDQSRANLHPLNST